MSREEPREKVQVRLEFSEVRDRAGRLLFRVSKCGILEIKRGGSREERELIDLKRFLDWPER